MRAGGGGGGGGGGSAESGRWQSYGRCTDLGRIVPWPSAVGRGLLFVLAIVVLPAVAEPQEEPALAKLLELAGAPSGETAPNPGPLDASATRGQQLPLFRAVMAQPLEAPSRAGALADSYRAAAASPHALMRLTAA